MKSRRKTRPEKPVPPINPGGSKFKLALLLLLLMLLHCRISEARPAAAPPTCHSPAVALTADYAYAVGSAAFSDPDGDPEAGSRHRSLSAANPSLSSPSSTPTRTTASPRPITTCAT